MNTWERGSCNRSPKKISCFKTSLGQIWNFTTPQVIDGSVVWQYLTALHWSLTQFTPAGDLNLRRGKLHPADQAKVLIFHMKKGFGWCCWLGENMNHLEFLSEDVPWISLLSWGKQQGWERKCTQEHPTEVWMFLHEMSRSASCQWSFLALLLSSSRRC